MRHIFQRCESDCFPTCIAMVAGITHSAAIELVHPRHQKGNDYATSLLEGAKALRRLGFVVWPRLNVHSFASIKNNAIISVHFKCEEFGHVVVWDANKKRILDPYKGYRTIPKCRYLASIDCVLELFRP
jgi:ABC-type bacteriocin/lantibiotic exporter with double-glycine peptidase domain